MAWGKTGHLSLLYPLRRAQETYLFEGNPQRLEKNFDVAFQIEEIDGPVYVVNTLLLVVSAGTCWPAFL